MIPESGRSAGKGIGYPLQYCWASLVAQLVKNLPAAGDLGLISRLGRSPGEEKGYPFQYSGLENSMDCIVHGVAKSQTQLNNFHFSTLYPSLAKGKLGKAEIPTSYSHLLVMCYFLSLIFHSFPSIKICSLVVFHS